jgi:hypothetical protein
MVVIKALFVLVVGLEFHVFCSRVCFSSPFDSTLLMSNIAFYEANLHLTQHLA